MVVAMLLLPGYDNSFPWFSLYGFFISPALWLSDVSDGWECCASIAEMSGWGDGGGGARIVDISLGKDSY